MAELTDKTPPLSPRVVALRKRKAKTARRSASAKVYDRIPSPLKNIVLSSSEMEDDDSGIEILDGGSAIQVKENSDLLNTCYLHTILPPSTSLTDISYLKKTPECYSVQNMNMPPTTTRPPRHVSWTHSKPPSRPPSQPSPLYEELKSITAYPFLDLYYWEERGKDLCRKANTTRLPPPCDDEEEYWEHQAYKRDLVTLGKSWAWRNYEAEHYWLSMDILDTRGRMGSAISGWHARQALRTGS